MPTRREVLKMLAAGSMYGALTACGARPTVGEGDPTPTNGPKATAFEGKTVTPTVAATAEIQKTNVPSAEKDYPKNYAELTREEMLSEAEFLKQMEKVSNVKKEYTQVKTMLSAGLVKAGVKLEEINFEVSSFAWEADKYSWIVIARNSKTGDVYVPRDSKTHTRNIDMSVYGYLGKYTANSFTMEKLPLPEFAGPEYKVGFARSKNGWLVATLDGGAQKGWYDFRDRQIARWKTSEDKSLILKGGVNIESRSYTQDQEVGLFKLRESLRDAISNKRLLRPSADFDSGTNGLCLTYSGNDFLIGLRECKTKDGKVDMVPMAMDATTGAYMISSDDGYFILSYPRESGVVLERDDVSELPKEARDIISFSDNGKREVRISYPVDNKRLFVYRKQGLIVSEDQYRHLTMAKYMPPRPFGVERISWPEIPLKTVEVSKSAFDGWVSALFDKYEDGTYKNIALKNTGYKIEETSLREALNLLRGLPDDLLKCLLKYPIKLELTAIQGVIGQRMRGSSLVQVSVSELQKLNNLRSMKIFASLVLHEQGHASQDSDIPAPVDFEFYTYYLQIRALHLFGLQNDSYTMKMKADWIAGTYPRRLV